MIVYAVFEVTDLQGYVELQRLVALRTTRGAADEVVSHKTSLNDYVVEQWEVLE